MEIQTEATRKRTCATYAGDMHALELHMLEAFERQLPITKNISDAHLVVVSLVATAKRHAQILNELVNSLGDVEKIVTDKLKSAVAGFFGIAAGLVDTVRPLAASKALRDSYTAVNHAIVGYVLLSTTAGALKNDETKVIAEEFLNDWINLAQKLMAVIPSIALRDLSDQGIQILDFAAASTFQSNQQWSCLFSRETSLLREKETVQEGLVAGLAGLTTATLPANLAAPNKIVLEKTVVEQRATLGRVDAPFVEVITKPVIVEETFRPEKIIEVQPVIHREIQANEIHHVERHIFEKVEANGPHVITNKPIVEEIIRPHIIEEVQEIIHRELPAPVIEKVEKHISEVEVLPTLHTKEVVLEKETTLEADLIVENAQGIKETKVITEKTTTVKGLSAGAPISGAL